MSEYKKLMGYSKKKKKIIKEQQKPKKNSIIDTVKQELNEWHHQPPTEKRWSGAFEAKDGLTEFERKGGKDNVNEGPAAEYAKSHQRIKKAYTEFWDSIADFQRLLIKKGLKPIARQVDKSYSGVDKFWKFYHKILDKLL